MQAPQPILHMDSVTLHELSPSVRTHSDLLRTIDKALADLVHGGVLREMGGTWMAGRVMVAKRFNYNDAQGRSYRAIEFGSWLCLALSMRVTREETRLALCAALEKHPIY